MVRMNGRQPAASSRLAGFGVSNEQEAAPLVRLQKRHASKKAKASAISMAGPV
jgi:hypothetical protein